MDNGKASVIPIANTDVIPYREFGLTKRELFAGMAMQGLCANSAIWDVGITPEQHAEEALQYADALLVALDDTPDTAEGVEYE